MATMGATDLTSPETITMDMEEGTMGKKMMLNDLAKTCVCSFVCLCSFTVCLAEILTEWDMEWDVTITEWDEEEDTMGKKMMLE